jgi:hypothetical protein
MSSDVVRDLIGGGIVAANRPVAERFGLYAAVLLHELAFWCRLAEQQGEEWAYRTQAEIRQATCLSDEAQLSARRKLVDAGVLIEKREGIPARMYFRVNWEELGQRILDSAKADTGIPEQRIHSLETSKEKVEPLTPFSDSENVIHLGDRSKAKQAQRADKEQQQLYRQWFDMFARHYPEHRADTQGNNPAWQAFRRLMAPQNTPLPINDAFQLVEGIKLGLADWLDSDAWEKDEGKYVPKLSNFFERRIWEQSPE